MRTLIITITIILFSSCSSKTNLAVNNCKSGIPGHCPACAYTGGTQDIKADKHDESMALMGLFWTSL